MKGLGQDTAKISKRTAQAAAKQIVAEPFEVLKNVPQQILSSEKQKPTALEDFPAADSDKPAFVPDKEAIKEQDLRRLKDLERDLNEIRREKIFKNLQAKITAGEPVYLEEYPELTTEQKQVLRAQAEAVKIRIREEKVAQGKVLEEPVTKPSRKFTGALKGIKGKVERLKRKAEVLIPPSG